MQSVFKKIYTILPLLIVVFFFQNCGLSNSTDTSENIAYEGISNTGNLDLK